MSEKSSLFEMALDRLLEDMDSTEGKAATAHSLEDCPSPLTCTQHDDETMERLAPEPKPSLEVEVHKEMAPGDVPALDDKGEKGEGLSPEDAEILKKILRG